jgi:hypothetical protein
VQKPFQVVGVLHVPRHPRVARLQQRLHHIEHCGLDQWLVELRKARQRRHDRTTGIGRTVELPAKCAR